MSKELCKGLKCDYCLNDNTCCSGEYQPLIDDSLCNNCRYADICYETHFPVVGCSEYKPDVPLAASAPRHISIIDFLNHFCPLPRDHKGGEADWYQLLH